MKPLILIGGGGHCKSVIDVAESAGYNILGILDRPEKVGNKVLDYTIIGVDDNLAQYVDKADFLVTVGQIKSPDSRLRLHRIIDECGGHLATVVSPKAHVSKYTTIGEGTVVMHQAVINADAHIGRGCIINTFANIEHDAEIGDYCHISTGAMVNGGVKVHDSVFIGSQSVVNQCVTICENCVVASGTVVSKDLIVSGIYAGHPVKLIKKY